FFNIAKDEKNLIGFNIKSFDIPFILKRALINDVIVCENFNGLNIKDCKKIANGFWYSYNKRAKGKLSDWAKIMGFEVETHNGGHVPKLYEEGKINEIVNHCIEDLKITRELWNRIKKCNLD
ncbi:MAG: ribonuclease H-like domain-containing protein, partial [Promethearchaeota archaeon]